MAAEAEPTTSEALAGTGLICPETVEGDLWPRFTLLEPDGARIALEVVIHTAGWDPDRGPCVSYTLRRKAATNRETTKLGQHPRS